MLDLADRAKPRLRRELVFNGSYLNSRRVDLDVHTAVVFPELDVPGLSYWPDELPVTWCGLKEHGVSVAEVQALFEKLRFANLGLIGSTPTTELLPSVRDVRHVDGGGLQVSEGPLSSCDEVYLSQSSDTRGFVSLVSFAIGEVAPPGASTIMSRPGAVYGSKDSLYLAVRHAQEAGQEWFSGLGDGVNEATSVHKSRSSRAARPQRTPPAAWSRAAF
ncbi:beta-propeller domain-containing protein [Nannocystis pusilla]|uniref:beta-propeller domain-containing protein n=1 Tax=Nannocystis pusilla TaxID=889268 RepID=UPI003B7F3682